MMKMTGVSVRLIELIQRLVGESDDHVVEAIRLAELHPDIDRHTDRDGRGAGEGAAAIIVFAPMLIPVAMQIGISPLHFGTLLVLAMGIGMFAPPLGLGLYACCAIGNVPIEATVKSIIKYFSVLFVCLLMLAFIPGITLMLPRHFGFLS